jgi:hypothetical protein
MRYAIAVIALGASIFAQGDVWGCATRPVMTTKLDDGTTMGVLVSDAQFKKAPAWAPGHGDPPLSIAKVVEIAEKWARTHYQGYDSAEIQTVSLSRSGCFDEPRYWYYLVHFVPIKNGKPSMGSSFAAVLFDGTLIGPTKVKDAF